jgi:hypothetical protein
LVKQQRQHIQENQRAERQRMMAEINDEMASDGG